MTAEVANAKSDVTLRSAAALRQVCRDVIAGEGSTVVGRMHFSRSIDDYDTALCARILLLAGRAGAAGEALPDIAMHVQQARYSST